MPPADRQLSKHFWLHEAPCWEHASETDVAKLQETAARVLQPVRNVFGPVYITSWKWWRDGCEPRTGTHAQGGTVDFVVSGGRTEDAWRWGNTHLMPSGYIGRWIYEPDGPSQNEHIHMAPRADRMALKGDGSIKSLRELPNGDMYVFQSWEAGTFVNPYRLEGITAYATAGIPWWLAAGMILALWTADLSVQAAGGFHFGAESREQRKREQQEAVDFWRPILGTS